MMLPSPLWMLAVAGVLGFAGTALLAAAGSAVQQQGNKEPSRLVRAARGVGWMLLLLGVGTLACAFMLWAGPLQRWF